MFRAQTSRGAVFIWRQGDIASGAPAPGTAAPRPKWQLRARGARTFVWRPPSDTSADIIIPGSVGNAVAAGVSGAVSQDITIAASVGNAVAAGVTGEASVGSDISIDGIVGNAVAAGVSGAASVSGSGTGATAEEIVTALMAHEIEPGVSVQLALRVILAAVSGPTAGIGTSTERYYDPDGVVARITATFDGDSNRTSVTLNGS